PQEGPMHAAFANGRSVHAMAFLVGAGAAAGCVGIDVGESSSAVSGDALSVVSVNVPPRVKPGGKLSVAITVKNTGSTTWRTGAVVLSYTGESGFTGTTLALPKDTKPQATATFSGSLGAPTQIGHYTLSWQATNGGAA